QVSITVRNTGKYDGEEVVQLYIHDKVASVVRPLKELKGFEKVFIKAGQSKAIHFTINKNLLSFYNSKLEWIAEPGEFEIMIGSSSAAIHERKGLTLVY